MSAPPADWTAEAEALADRFFPDGVLGYMQLRNAMLALVARVQAASRVGPCRNGAPHYCPNCDCTFGAPEAR